MTAERKAAGWTQRDFALGLAFHLGSRPKVTTRLGNLTLGGTSISVIEVPGKRPTFVLDTAAGSITALAETLVG